MERTPSTNENHRPRRRLLTYGIGFVLLTNALTVLFIFVLRGPRLRSIAVVPGASPAAEEPAPAVAPPVATRQVQVTSRPSGAVVRYQGNVQGTTPVAVTLPADEAGVLNLEKAGYRSRSVTVKPGETRVRVRLYQPTAAGAAATQQPAAAGTPAPAPATPARAPGNTQPTPTTTPQTAPRTAPARAPGATPAAPGKAAARPPQPAARAPAAKDTGPRPAQPQPARRPASSENPAPAPAVEPPAADASKNPDSPSE